MNLDVSELTDWASKLCTQAAGRFIDKSADLETNDIDIIRFPIVVTLVSFLQRTEDLSCVINGAQRRAVWLSWSMVLCR